MIGAIGAIVAALIGAIALLLTKQPAEKNPAISKPAEKNPAISKAAEKNPAPPEGRRKSDYFKSCLISLHGDQEGYKKQDSEGYEKQDFEGVAGNYPDGEIWNVSCAGFEPNVPVSAYVRIAFDIGAGGNAVSVRPFVIADGVKGPQGTLLSHPGPGSTGFLTSTATGRSSKNGTVTIGFYLGIPNMITDRWTLTARPGSYIRITLP